MVAQASTALLPVTLLTLLTLLSAAIATAQASINEGFVVVAPGDGTLLRARDQVRAARSLIRTTRGETADTGSHPVVLRLGAGIFRLADTFVLGSLDSNTTWVGDGAGASIIEVEHYSAAAIQLKAASNITLRGVTLRRSHRSNIATTTRTPVTAVCEMWNGTGAVLHLEHGNDCRVLESQVVGGVAVHGGWRHTLDRLDLAGSTHGTPSGCLTFADAGESRSLKPCGHTISNSQIHDCTNADGIGLANVTGALVTHNEVRHVGCAGIRVDGNIKGVSTVRDTVSVSAPAVCPPQ